MMREKCKMRVRAMMREKCTEKSRHSMPGNGHTKKENRGIPRGTEQSNKPLKERKKENGKDHNDVRYCVYIGTRRELLLQDDEGDRKGVHAPGKGRKAKVKSQETCERGDGAAAEAV
jgi:hypothetical protein